MKKIVPVLILVVLACSRKTESPARATTPAPAPKPAATSSQAAPLPPIEVVPRSSTGVLDACGLISPDDLKRITGSGFRSGVNTTTEADVMRCTFPRTDGGGINLTLHLENVIGEYRAMPGMVSVASIPDEALWSPQVTTFVDRKGSQVLAVGFNFAGGNQEKWGEEIVLEILPKL